MTLSPTLTPADLTAHTLGQLRPRPAPDLWAWASEHLVLPEGHRFSPTRGLLWRRWYRRAWARLTRTPLPEDPAAHQATELYLIVAAGVAKTTWEHAVLLYMLKYAPRRAALYMRRRKPDLASARTMKLQVQLDRTPDLAPLLPQSDEARARALGPDFWRLGAAQIYFRSAVVLDDWRDVHFELLVLGEFDRYPERIEGHEDPLTLADGRQRPYRRTRLRLGGTSPGEVSGAGWRTLCRGSHERPLVTCPRCRAVYALDPRQVCLLGARDLAEVSPDEIRASSLARYACQACDERLTDGELHAMVRAAAIHDTWCPGTWELGPETPTGRWRPAADLDSAGRLLGKIPPAAGSILTGQAGALYADTVSLTDFAVLTAKALQGTPAERRTLYADTWAEPLLDSPAHDQSADELETAVLADYRRGQCPEPRARWCLLVFDQQGNRRDLWSFPWVALAVAEDGLETWRIDAGWAKSEAARDELLERRWLVGGSPRAADWVVTDCANGHALFDLRLWASTDPDRRLLLRGDHALRDGTPWERVRKGTKETPLPDGVNEYRFHPNYWPDQLDDRLRRRAGAPPWHLPPEMPRSYLASLLSEHRVQRERRIPGTRATELKMVWEPRVIESPNAEITQRRDNHWFRCEAMALAAIDILGLIQTTPSSSDPTWQQADANAQAWLSGYA